MSAPALIELTERVLGAHRPSIWINPAHIAMIRPDPKGCNIFLHNFGSGERVEIQVIESANDVLTLAKG